MYELSDIKQIEQKNKACSLIYQLKTAFVAEKKKNATLEKEIASLHAKLSEANKLNHQHQQQQQQQALGAPRPTASKTNSNNNNKEYYQQGSEEERERRETVVMLKESFALEKLRLTHEIESLKEMLDDMKKKYAEMEEANEKLIEQLELQQQGKTSPVSPTRGKHD